MAQAVVKYVFAALLALVSTQPFVSSARLQAVAEIAWSAAAERQATQDSTGVHRQRHPLPAAPKYVSRLRPEPDSTAHFQRPPPNSSLFA